MSSLDPTNITDTFAYLLTQKRESSLCQAEHTQKQLIFVTRSVREREREGGGEREGERERERDRGRERERERGER